MQDHVWILKQTETDISYRVSANKCTCSDQNENSDTVETSRKRRRRNNHSDVQSQHNYPLHICNSNKQTDGHNPKLTFDPEAVLRDYFQLHISLVSLYSQWSAADANFRKIADNFSGIRIMRQDPVENLFAFICSSNNNISRISAMVEKLCANFSELIVNIDGTDHYAFPSVKRLAGDDVEQRLRELGFGYRARYIAQSAQYISLHLDVNWLISLRDKTYPEAKSELMKLCGVGAKVADCVCLMSLDKPSVIPVDTHVWNIATKLYNTPSLKDAKSLTNTRYKQIGDFFHELWGEYAGWAHSVLFSADLKKFQDKRV